MAANHSARVLTEAMAAGGGEAKRAFDAMMNMKKIDVATIEAARRGLTSRSHLAANLLSAPVAARHLSGDGSKSSCSKKP